MRSRTVSWILSGKEGTTGKYCEHGFQFHCDQESKEEAFKMRVGNRRREKIEVRIECVRRRLDKACADSLLECRESEAELKSMFQEYQRVVRPGGKIIVLTKWFDQKRRTELERRESNTKTVHPFYLIPNVSDNSLILRCHDTILKRYEKRHRYVTLNGYCLYYTALSS